MPRGGIATRVDPGLVARLSGAVKGMIRGAADGWFGPAEPHPAQAPPEVRGRQWDYPFAVNISTNTPRGEQGETGMDFPTLRALADPTLGGFDLLRLAVEKRKNQMAGQRWTIRGRAKPGQKPNDGGPRAREIEELLRFPDLEHTFAQWSRMLDEDLLVIDAPCVYLAPSTLGYRIPQVMDGATLRRLIRLDGRTPLPPDPAFQQVIKGLPAVDYALDELVYMPRNLRSNRMYGMSPVEQVHMTVSIALRRQLAQLEEYSEGNIPSLLITAPLDWKPEQIREVQAWFDTLAGDTAAKRRMRLVPGGLEPFPLRESPLKDEWDEWLARIVCYCFDLSPQSLVKEMNRATAQTGKQAAQEEGLEPLKLHRKDFMDSVLAKAFGAPELEYAFLDEEIADPQVKAEVTSLALGGKPWLTQDEARADYGKPPMTPEQKDELNPEPLPVAEGTGPAAEKDVEQKVLDIQKRAAEPMLALVKAMHGSRAGPGPRTIHKEFEFKRDEKTGAVSGATATISLREDG